MSLSQMILVIVGMAGPFYSMAQDRETVVQSIRDRYYHINSAGVDLTHSTIDKYDVYSEDGKVAIIKEPTSNGVYEYYFDEGQQGLFPYFIYFETKDQSVKPYLRAYLDDTGDIIWFKKNDEEVEIHYYNNDPNYYLIFQAMNALNTTKNVNIPEDKRVLEVESYIKSVDKMHKRLDTLSYHSVPDEGHYEDWNFLYYSDDGQKLVSRQGSGGEHGSDQTVIYFKDGVKCYSVNESSRWVGFYDSIIISITYLENGEAFREEVYRSYGVNVGRPDNGLLWFDRDKMVPEISLMSE